MLPALLVAASTVAVRLIEVQDLPVETQLGLARACVAAIEERTGNHAVLDDPEWPGCGQSFACAEQVMARTHATRTVFMRVLLSAELVRVMLKVPEREGGQKGAQVDLSLSAGDWAAGLAAPVIELFGAGPPLQRPPLLAPAPPAPSRVVPVSLMALGAASLAAGAAVGVMSQATQADFDRALTWGTVVPSTRGDLQAQATGANVLMVAGAGALLSGLGWWLFTD